MLRRTGRVMPWLLLALVVVLAALVGVWAFRRWYVPPPPPPDPALAAELAAATIEEVPAAPASEEWPQWRGPHRDGVSGETDWLKEWPAGGPPVLWRKPCGGGFSAPVIVADRLYTMEQAGEEEAVVCRDADTGNEVWRHRYPCKSIRDYSGPRSTPTIHDGRVYAVGSTGLFHCLDAETGTVHWQHDLLSQFGVENIRWGASFSPLIEGDLVLTNPGGNGASVAAFDRTDGRFVWKALDDPAGYSSPIAIDAAGKRQAIFFTGNSLVSLAPADGSLYWRYPWPTKHDVNAATPIHFRAAGGDYLFISSGYDKGCAVVKVVAAGNRLDVRTVWFGTQMRNHFSTCVRQGNHVYGFDENDLKCLDLRTGETTWEQGGFGKGSLLLADGHLIVLGEKGELALVEATPQKYRQKASFDLRRRRYWTVPVLVGGLLYVRDESEIVCLDLRAR